MSQGISSIGVVGVVLAMFLSWSKWSSVGWTILHGFLGWLYVIYYLIVY